jgi:hypothetical protein
MALALVGMSVSFAQVWRKAEHQRIIVLATSESSGNFDRLQYVELAGYQPGEKTLEHFAFLFVTDYYSRIRYSLAHDFSEASWFLSPEKVKERNTKEESTHWIEAFLKSADLEIHIKIGKVRTGGCSRYPCHMSVDFEKHYFSAGREREDMQETWTAELSYSLMPEPDVTTDMIPVNPIGLTVGEIRESRGF